MQPDAQRMVNIKSDMYCNGYLNIKVNCQNSLSKIRVDPFCFNQIDSFLCQT